MNNKILDNSNDNLSMRQALKDCIKAEGVKEIRIATGYWDIPGMALVFNELKEFLKKKDTKLQLLIGTDPYVYKSQIENSRYEGVGEDHPCGYIRKDIEKITLKEEYQDVVALLLDKYNKDKEEDGQIQIRIYKETEKKTAQFLHAKCYIFSGDEVGYGIIGSSNFTCKGLQGNAELNYLETNSVCVTSSPKNSNLKTHLTWFQEKWDKSLLWTREFLEQILGPSKIAKEVRGKALRQQSEKITPYELYIKLLQCRFGNVIDKDLSQVLESYLPSGFDVFEYQLDAVKQCYNIMKEHGGFMLADVVGLGKTVVGTMILKHFLSDTDDGGRDRKVLIITPPAIQSAWKETIQRFDTDAEEKMTLSIDYVTTGSIGNLVDDTDEGDDNRDSGEFAEELSDKNYGLILIDESHKFRNNETAMYKALDKLIGEIGGKTGAYPYIGLLSATPQNNRPDDLKHQIYLFERNHTDSTLKQANGGNLESFFAGIARRYKGVIENPATSEQALPESIDKNKEELKKLSKEVRECILQDILVRRTRTDIQKFYPETQITFPVIKGPHSLKYKLGKDLATLFARTMELIAPKENLPVDGFEQICFYRYRAVEFLNDETEKKLLYEEKKIDARQFSLQLARIVRNNLVKRIESSFSAFKASLENLCRYTQNMIDMWNADAIFICPQINVNAELNPKKHWARTGETVPFEQCLEDIRAKIKNLDERGEKFKGRNKEYNRSDFDQEYFDLLTRDLEEITKLKDDWSRYPDDPKLNEFKNRLVPELLNAERNPAQKLVIFTEAVDTADVIQRAVKSVDDSISTLTITAKNRDEKEQIIKENFDANYKGAQKDDYQIIITTEVLAEGINLHRANSILNYDTPWNSTRLMQRIGRVNRIGSRAEEVHVYNFMPSAEGDAEINLVRKAHTKLQSFHILFGEDSQIFTQEEEVMANNLQMQVNGAESPLEKYFYELKNYKEANPERYAYIAQKQEGLELATTSGKGDAYFLVRAPKLSGMLVRYDAEKKESAIISPAKMYELFRTASKAALASLPDSWDEQKKSATFTVNQRLSQMNILMTKSDRATKAKKIINGIKEDPSISEDSKKLLAKAFRLVNKGNIDIIKKIFNIEDQLKTSSQIFCGIDAIIKSGGIEAMVASVEKKVGEAKVFIGLSH